MAGVDVFDTAIKLVHRTNSESKNKSKSLKKEKKIVETDISIKKTSICTGTVCLLKLTAGSKSHFKTHYKSGNQI